MPFAFRLVAYATVFIMAIITLYTIKDLFHVLRKEGAHASVRRTRRHRQ